AGHPRRRTGSDEGLCSARGGTRATAGVPVVPADRRGAATVPCAGRPLGVPLSARRAASGAGVGGATLPYRRIGSRPGAAAVGAHPAGIDVCTYWGIASCP